MSLDAQVRGKLKALPALDSSKLWSVQKRAIENLERSLAKNNPRSLIQMATGSGKTFTAVNACYRLIKFGGARRVLFLVDRSNLGRQTYREFQQFVSPVNAYKFTDEYHVQLLNSNTVAPTSKVVITTIQRLYSVLKGEEEFDEAADEQSQFELATSLVKEPLPVVYNERIPIETFDFVIVDECHRSIYNLWRQVLDYFDSFLIGLTATPTAQTIGFFNNNLVMEYGHEQAVADGVNVGFDVYRIRTRITEQGATLEGEPGRFIPRRDRRTRSKRYAELDDDLNYEPNQLDRDVVAEDQIRLVVRTFKQRLFTEIFPGRTEVPKTLVFAKDDSHAEDITRILREEFGKGNDFAQKITYRTTGKKPEDLLAEFRNSYNPRIAVTVDMIATGTDVKPLECLLFMRNVKSAAYFEQMKGRGVRVVDLDALRSVTPDAEAKTHFVIVDAIGVSEQDKTATKPLDRQPSVPLDKIMGLVAAGAANPDLVSTLAARLARLDRQLTDEQRQQVTQQAGGKDLNTLTTSLLGSLDPDAQAKKATEVFGLAKDQEATPEQLDQVQDTLLAAALKPFHDPKLRDLLLNLKRSHEQVIDEITQDELLQAGLRRPRPRESPGADHELQAVHRAAQGRTRSHPDPLQPTAPGGAAVPAGQRPRRRPQEPTCGRQHGAGLASLRGDGAAGGEGQGRQRCRGSHRPGAARPRPARADRPLLQHGAGALRAVAHRAGTEGRGLHRGAAPVARRHQGSHRQEPADRGRRF